jgi:hypothetical protein
MDGVPQVSTRTRFGLPLTGPAEAYALLCNDGLPTEPGSVAVDEDEIERLTECLRCGQANDEAAEHVYCSMCAEVVAEACASSAAPQTSWKVGPCACDAHGPSFYLSCLTGTCGACC